MSKVCITFDDHYSMHSFESNITSDRRLSIRAIDSPNIESATKCEEETSINTLSLYTFFIFLLYVFFKSLYLKKQLSIKFSVVELASSQASASVILIMRLASLKGYVDR
jgi:hypothetical protein